MRFFLRLSFVFAFILCNTVLQAQNMGSSPYSQLGIGDIVNPAFGPQQAMGSAGVAYSNGFFINNMNPALWARNRSVTLEVGVIGQYKKMSTSDASKTVTGGTLNNLALALPVARYWTTGLVLSPLSSVNYDISDTRILAGTAYTATTRYLGKGGFTSLNWNNGFSLLKNQLYLGLQTSYIFGATTKENISQVHGLPFTSAYTQNITASGFTFKPGFAYRKRVNYDKRDSLKIVYVSFAGTYDIPGRINLKRDQVLENRSDNGESGPFGQDSLVKNESGRVLMPGGFRAGFNIEKPFKWAVSGDFYYKNWSGYDISYNTDSLSSAYGFGVGAEYTPDINSVNSYLKRVTLRAGFNYSQMPIKYNDKQLSDRSISFGASFPVTTQDRSALSYLNATFVLGQRGDKAMVKENYFKIVFDFSISAFDWFRRYKID
ncbi:hypothetical protein [Xanthocytophaga agilis]|uniref:Outer membrane protein n=1 Tax=Xanthocytophaga agilis TaxID=3048010 RepID=A0AAE3UHS0_9BACT|nr:hypothetical protein [Xanthocytophaga agilis]MDJ1503792.1 hypothetical protein [Xanthocytophaga agilis]